MLSVLKERLSFDWELSPNRAESLKNAKNFGNLHFFKIVCHKIKEAIWDLITQESYDQKASWWKEKRSEHVEVENKYVTKNTVFNEYSENTAIL